MHGMHGITIPAGGSPRPPAAAGTNYELRNVYPDGSTQIPRGLSERYEALWLILLPCQEADLPVLPAETFAAAVLQAGLHLEFPTKGISMEQLTTHWCRYAAMLEERLATPASDCGRQIVPIHWDLVPKDMTDLYAALWVTLKPLREPSSPPVTASVFSAAVHIAGVQHGFPVVDHSIECLARHWSRFETIVRANRGE